ncbi:hypothetical protein IU501_35385 [Nocardia otitidiscaviarum]|uniref:relaxase/mobilization nuclease domain-containing protein n=1 Tax=Nocardia otitidiscaviarum TaxID=1823 RepID=UPI0018957D49|nr:hypothetical protein [Nocardia otitidiscaviarum]MBF6138258.1 hypothetical protein [Nocardia otitidiscaviarum]
MIPKISRGQKIGGLMVYLLGEGDHNEHKDRHIIAGSPTVMRAQWLAHFDGPGDNEASRDVALAVAHEIDIPRKLYGTQVRMKAKPVAVGVGGGAGELGSDVVEPAGKGEKSQMRDAPVWHCVLSLSPGEELSDERWAKVVNDFMGRMGFTGTADGRQAPARWAAVRHGHSGEHGDGQDHIHIAASLVREDGSKVSTFDYGPGRAKGDWKRAQEVCGELEREYGLKVLASRHEGGGLSGNSRAETERAREGTGETERERLRRAVRAVATAAENETEFVRGLREAGVALRPRYAQGDTTDVTGYSVRFQRGGGEVGPWVGGGKLAKDLTLTALREQQWDDTPAGRDDALAAWKNRTPGTGSPGRVREGGVDAWQRAATEAERWRERLAQVPHHDRAQWAWMAGQAAGVFSAWSETLEKDKPGAFAAAATELTRSAQTHRAGQRYRPPRGTHPTGFGDLAQLLLAHPSTSRPRSHRGNRQGEDAVTEIAVILLVLMLLLLLLAIAVAVEIARAHRARGELGRAVAVEHMTREHLDPVRASWEGELRVRRFQFDRDAAEVFTSIAERRARGRSAGVDTSASSQLGDERVAALGEAAEALVPGITAAEAWPALRERLAAIEAAGGDAAQQLAAVAAQRELGSADDPAAVLSWRLEHHDGGQESAPPRSESATVENAPQTQAGARALFNLRRGINPPDPETVERRKREQEERWEASEKSLAAATGPLTPPTPAAPNGVRRKYFSELTEEEKAQQRMYNAVTAQFASRDLRPRGWTDELLAAELEHRRTEVALLAADLDAHHTDGGPHTRQVHADNAELAEQAEKIRPAQQAQAHADQLRAQRDQLIERKKWVQRQLDETSRHRMLARSKLQTQITDLDTQLAAIAPDVTAAETAAHAAAEATGVPDHEWDTVLRQADERHQQYLLNRAREADQRIYREDSSWLRRLQRDLAGVEEEAARREQLTPEQREREARIRTHTKPPAPGKQMPFMPGIGQSTGMPYQPPDLGRGMDRDHGPSL